MSRPKGAALGAASRFLQRAALGRLIARNANAATSPACAVGIFESSRRRIKTGAPMLGGASPPRATCFIAATVDGNSALRRAQWQQLCPRTRSPPFVPSTYMGRWQTVLGSFPAAAAASCAPAGRAVVAFRLPLGADMTRAAYTHRRDGAAGSASSRGCCLIIRAGGRMPRAPAGIARWGTRGTAGAHESRRMPVGHDRLDTVGPYYTFIPPTRTSFRAAEKTRCRRAWPSLAWPCDHSPRPPLRSVRRGQKK